MLPETTKEGLVDPSPSAQADTTEHVRFFFYVWQFMS